MRSNSINGSVFSVTCDEKLTFAVAGGFFSEYDGKRMVGKEVGKYYFHKCSLSLKTGCSGWMIGHGDGATR